MRVTLARDQLAAVCGGLRQLASGARQNPVTRNLLLVAKKGTLTIAATNLEQYARQTLREVEVAKPGTCLLDATLLSRIADSGAGETMVIEQDAKSSQVSIQCGRDKFNLTTADADEYPKWPEGATKDTGTLAAKDVLAAMTKLPKLCSLEKGRYALNGLFVEPRANAFEFCATDGRRLGYLKVAGRATAVDYQIILPPAACALMAKLLAHETGEIEISFSHTLVCVKCGDTELWTFQVEGRFPDYRSVLPNDNPVKATLDTAAMQAALKRASHLTSVESQAVRFEFGKGELRLRSKSPARGDAEAVVDAELVGEPVIAGFDPHYVADVLSAYGGEKVVVELKDKDTGALFSSGDRAREYYLVMPSDI